MTKRWRIPVLLMALTGAVCSAQVNNGPAATAAAAAAAAAAADLATATPTTTLAAPTVMETQSLLNQALTLQSEQKWQEAIKLYDRILKADPTNEAAIFGLGTSYGQVGRYQEGLTLLENLLKQVPNHPDVLNNIAWIYAKATDPAIHNPDKALRLARRALVNKPSDYNIWNTLAEAYYGKGDYQKAYRVARQGLQLATASGETDLTACKELVERCRRAAGATEPPAEAADDNQEE